MCMRSLESIAMLGSRPTCPVESRVRETQAPLASVAYMSVRALPDGWLE